MSTPHYIGRFAPSPSGPLHFGSLIAALASYLDARAVGGQWHLRIDDVDRGRCQTGAASAIQHTLEAYGLHWDGPVQTQDAHRERYAAALSQLISAERAYPCACTRGAIEAIATLGPAGRIYPGTCRNGLPSDAEPRSWRFRGDNRAIRFNDRHAGVCQVMLSDQIGDFVLRRGDGLHAYHLAMVIDDAALGVTDCVRGGDLLPATAPQIALQKALNLPTPRYLHLPVAFDARGAKLSKTNAAPALDDQQPSPTLTAALRFLGQTCPPDAERLSPHELLTWACQHWDTQRIPTLEEAIIRPLHPSV